MGSTIGDGAEPRRSTPLAIDLVVAGFLYIAVVVGFFPWYSERLFDRGTFEAYYGQGVYRFRLIGPELVLWVESLIGNPLGEHLVVNGRTPHDGDLYTALVLVNALAFLVAVLLARRVLERSAVAEPGRMLVMVTLLVIVALSLFVVTPYDLLSYALILAVLVSAGSRRPWDLVCVPLVVVGVLTRESVFVAVAALAVHAVVTDAGQRRVRVVVAAAAAGAATYIGVRVGASSPDLWSSLTLRGNLARLIELAGLGLMVAAYLVWQHACALAGIDGPAVRRGVRWLWILAAPYVAVALLAGYWFELRLLVPMLIAELWLRAELRSPSHGGSPA